MEKYPEIFQTFWQAYPRKTAKGDAWKAWQKLAPTQAELDVMLRALAWQVDQSDWHRDGGTFIPYPASWLNGRRWEDEPFHVEQRPRSLGRPYQGWECPHEPKCEQRIWCEIKCAQEAEQQA